MERIEQNKMSYNFQETDVLREDKNFISKFLDTLKLLYICIFPFSLLVLASLLVFLASSLTLFRCRRFVMEMLVAPLSRFVLLSLGLRVRYEGPVFPLEQTVYIANHLSAFDILAICALGLPNTHYLLSVSTLKYFPLTLIGLCTGVFYVPEQSNGTKRRALFIRCSEFLKATGRSIFLTPEGLRNSGLELQKFNKGAFHLAKSLNCQVFCLYIDCPKSCHPGYGLVAKSGVMTVRHIGTLETRFWSEENVVANTEFVRKHYLNFISSLRKLDV